MKKRKKKMKRKAYLIEYKRKLLKILFNITTQILIMTIKEEMIILSRTSRTVLLITVMIEYITRIITKAEMIGRAMIIISQEIKEMTISTVEITETVITVEVNLDNLIIKKESLHMKMIEVESPKRRADLVDINKLIS
jgi:hypothetical protein